MALLTVHRRTVLGAISTVALKASALETELETIRLPVHNTSRDPQLDYVQALIQLGMEKVGLPYEIRPVPLEMHQARSLLDLASGRSAFDLMWTMTDTAREASGALPIRIPIDRGLIGWRLPVVRKKDLPKWSRVKSLADLQGLVAGQGQEWPDTAILRANRLPVVTGNQYGQMFRMLSQGRFDYFPRSIMEIDAELANGQHPDLAFVPRLMLHYPAAVYLFVSPERSALASRLTQGLEAAVADGSLQRLHQQCFGALLRDHPVPPERVLHLSNPLLPERTPLSRPELWLQPT